MQKSSILNLSVKNQMDKAIKTKPKSILKNEVYRNIAEN